MIIGITFKDNLLIMLPWWERVGRWKTLSSLLQLYFVFVFPHSRVTIQLLNCPFSINNWLETIREVFVLPFCAPHCSECDPGWKGRGRREGKKLPLNISSSISICLLKNTDNVGRISSVELLSKLWEYKHMRTGNYSVVGGTLHICILLETAVIYLWNQSLEK